MVRETHISPSDFIYPLFVTHGKDVRRPITSMPGVFQLSIDQLAEEASGLQQLGIPAVMLFGIPQEKDPVGIENFSTQGIISQAIRALKELAQSEKDNDGYLSWLKAEAQFTDPAARKLCGDGLARPDHFDGAATVVATHDPAYVDRVEREVLGSEDEPPSEEEADPYAGVSGELERTPAIRGVTLDVPAGTTTAVAAAALSGPRGRRAPRPGPFPATHPPGL